MFSARVPVVGARFPKNFSGNGLKMFVFSENERFQNEELIFGAGGSRVRTSDRIVRKKRYSRIRQGKLCHTDRVASTRSRNPDNACQRALNTAS